MEEEVLDTDFDPEKLREYEASRLKYFFAIVEMASPSHADTVYKEVDGMEFEHSSAALDVRSIPSEEIPNITKDRPMRDEAASIPSNYEPPEFVVSALQQTNVQCTWEVGDRDRERTLTKYATSGQDWRDIAESDDIKAYLGSDASSDEEEEEEAGKNKASRMRQMLGLDSDDDQDGKDNSDDDERSSDGAGKRDSFLTFDDNDDDEAADCEADGNKEVAFVPGAEKLEDKIRSSIEKKKGGSEPTPFEQYLEKKKKKRKERKAAARAKRDEINESRRGTKKSSNDRHKKSTLKSKKEGDEKAKAELELLVANDGDDEDTRDYDMPVLDGTDDRFGIDRTDPQFKETSAMREIMAEQTRRRKKRKTKTASVIAPDVSADSIETSKGGSALSSLVSRLKQKVKS
eukprot:scaffold1314_cov158-Amphora_coffeaeformis.AAC.7